jgi:hypothetical protein
MHRTPRTCHPMGLARQVRVGVLTLSLVPASPGRPLAVAVPGERGVESMIMAAPTSVATERKTPELA